MTKAGRHVPKAPASADRLPSRGSDAVRSALQGDIGASSVASASQGEPVAPTGEIEQAGSSRFHLKEW